MLILNVATAQVPQGFKYQTAIRDNNGAVIANKLVAIKLSLLTGSANGTAVYSEVHNVATNDFGVANLNVGNGTINSGNFSTIDWGNNTFFLKTEVDINNGTNFTFMGSSQLLSVPFAMYAAKSANAADDKDKDSTNELQAISLNNNNLQLNKNGGSVDLTKYDKDSQQLVLNGNTLSITKGNSIVLGGAVDLDADPTNEIQNLSLSKDTLKLSKANYVVLPKDNDADSTNEIQSLSVNQNKLSISKSNQVNIDADTTNEIQSLQQNGNSISLSKNGGSIKVPSLTNIQNGSILYATASGTNNFFLTLQDSISSYVTGMTINFKVPNSNTGHVTININNLGIKPLFKNVSDTIKNGEIRAGKIYSIIYDGIRFQLLNQLNNYYFSSGITNKNDTITNDFKITDYGFPGKVNRIIYVPPNTNFKYLVPIDTIAILSGNSALLTAAGYTCTYQYANIKSTIVVGTGDSISFLPSSRPISFVLSKAFVTPIMIYKGITFTVPLGKKLCLLKGSKGTNQSCVYSINASTNTSYPEQIDFYQNEIPVFYPSGTTILISDYPGQTCTGSFINGYLFD